MYNLSSKHWKKLPILLGEIYVIYVNLKENLNISVCFVDHYEFTRIPVDHLRVFFAMQSKLAITLT